MTGQHILHIAAQASVSLGAESRQLRLTAAHIVKQDLAVRGGESGCDVAPHVLAAAKPVGKQNHRPAASQISNVVAFVDVHGLFWILDSVTT